MSKLAQAILKGSSEVSRDSGAAMADDKQSSDAYKQARLNFDIGKSPKQTRDDLVKQHARDWILPVEEIMHPPPIDARLDARSLGNLLPPCFTPERLVELARKRKAHN